MASIKNDFSEHKREDWLKAIAKTLKLEPGADVSKYINLKNAEGLSYNLDPNRDVKPLCLNTFPLKTKLIRELKPGIKTIEKKEDGVEYVLCEDKPTHHENQNIFQIVKNLDVDLFGDTILFDFISFSREHDFNESKIAEKLKAYKDQAKLSFLIDTSRLHNAGLNPYTELAVAMKYALSSLEYVKKTGHKIYFMTATDSMFFASVSKLRALRYTFETILEQSGVDPTNTFEIIAKPSMCEMTLFEPWANALRSSVSTAAHLIAGADFTIPSDYNDALQDLSTETASNLSRRQSRNIFHVLNLESSLGFVNDPAKGSYAIEDLSREMVEKSFSELKELSKKKDLKACMFEVSEQAKNESEFKANIVNTRKKVICGVSDFSDTDQKISIESLNAEKGDLFPLRRNTARLEELRLFVQNHEDLSDKKTLILTYGDRKKLSTRMSFVQNYFEVLGLKTDILEWGEKVDQSKYIACTLCAQDTDYPEFLGKNLFEKGIITYIAGKKYKTEKAKNIFQGQNIFEVLNELISEVKS